MLLLEELDSKIELNKTQVPIKFNDMLSEGKPTRMRRLCLKTSEAEGRGGLGITSSSEEVYELML